MFSAFSLFSAVIALTLISIVVIGERPSFRKLLNPSVTYLVVIALNAATFYNVSIRRAFPPEFAHVWSIARNYSDQAHSVLAFYLVLTLVILFAQWLSWRTTNRFRTAGVQSEQKAEPSDSLLWLSRRILRYLLSPLGLLGLLGLNFVFLLYVVDVEWTTLASYSTYLSTREPLLAGLELGVTAFLHRVIPIIGVLLTPLAVIVALVAPLRSKLILAPLIVPALSVCVLVSVAFVSRFVLVQLVVAAVTMWLLHKHTTSRVLVGFGVSLLAVFLYGAIIGLRKAAPDGVGEFGLLAMVAALVDPGRNYLFTGLLPFQMLINFFGGGFVLAEAFRNISAHYSYPEAYKLLSFSPLISAIDGFDEYGYVTDIMRAGPTAPYSTFAEGILFGPGYLVIVVALHWLMVFLASRVWLKHGAGVWLVLIPFYYVVIRMNAYGVRHTARLVYLTVLAVTVLEQVNARRLRRARGLRGGKTR